jgi:O-antigen ligase
MNIAAPQPQQLTHLYFGVILLAIVAAGGVVAVYSPAIAIGGSAIAMGGIAALVFMRRSNLLISAMTSYGILLAYPALLPRTGIDRMDPATGGAMDTRALAQLALFTAIIIIACWLWLMSDAGISGALQGPLSILTPYAFVALVSLSYTPSLGWPAYSYMKLLTPLFLLIVLGSVVTTARNLKQVIDIGLVATTFLLVVFWLDILRGAAVRQAGRWSTDWMHPNSATLIAVTLMLILTVRFLTSPPSTNRFLMVMGAAFAGFTALMSASKSSLGAAAVALVVVTIIIIIKKPTGSMLARMVVLGLGVLGTVNYFLVNNVGIGAHLAFYGDTTDEGSLTGRVPIWNVAIEETLSSHMTTFFGHGYLSTFALKLDGYFWTTGQAHNSFIQTFFDLGLVGLILVVTLYVSTLIKAIRAIARYDIWDSRWVRAMELMAAFTAFTVDSFTEDIMGGTLEVRTVLFILIIFCIHQNLKVTSNDHHSASKDESEHLRRDAKDNPIPDVAALASLQGEGILVHEGPRL